MKKIGIGYEDYTRYEDGIIEDGYAGVIFFGMCFCKKKLYRGIQR